tara:strand:+ start:175 stop:897 length:723 start_codon:yes stop_codon:yes gene_type:complete
MLVEYTPTIVGLVLDVSKSEGMAAAKQALVKFFAHFNNEDRIYLYGPNNTDIPRRRGETLGKVMNHNHHKIRMGLAIKQCVWLMDAEDEEDYKKIIFVITDGINPLHNYEIRKALFYDREGEFEFVFLCLDDEAFNRLDLNLHREHAVVNFTRLEVPPLGLYKAMVTKLWPDFEFPPEPEVEKAKQRQEDKPVEKPKEEVKIQVAKISLDDLEEELNLDDLEEKDAESKECAEDGDVEKV